MSRPPFGAGRGQSQRVGAAQRPRRGNATGRLEPSRSRERRTTTRLRSRQRHRRPLRPFRSPRRQRARGCSRRSTQPCARPRSCRSRRGTTGRPGHWCRAGRTKSPRWAFQRRRSRCCRGVRGGSSSARPTGSKGRPRTRRLRRRAVRRRCPCRRRKQGPGTARPPPHKGSPRRSRRGWCCRGLKLATGTGSSACT